MTGTNIYISGYLTRQRQPPLVSGDAARWQLNFARSGHGPDAGSAEDHVIAHALNADIVTAIRSFRPGTASPCTSPTSGDWATGRSPT